MSFQLTAESFDPYAGNRHREDAKVENLLFMLFDVRQVIVAFLPEMVCEGGSIRRWRRLSWKCVRICSEINSFCVRSGESAVEFGVGRVVENVLTDECLMDTCEKSKGLARVNVRANYGFIYLCCASPVKPPKITFCYFSKDFTRVRFTMHSLIHRLRCFQELFFGAQIPLVSSYCLLLF